MLKLRILRGKDYPVSARWAFKYHHMCPKSKAMGDETTEEKAMWRDLKMLALKTRVMQTQ